MEEKTLNFMARRCGLRRYKTLEINTYVKDMALSLFGSLWCLCDIYVYVLLGHFIVVGKLIQSETSPLQNGCRYMAFSVYQYRNEMGVKVYIKI